jgi:hypothetical protein
MAPERFIVIVGVKNLTKSTASISKRVLLESELEIYREQSIEKLWSVCFLGKLQV